MQILHGLNAMKHCLTFATSHYAKLMKIKMFHENIPKLNNQCVSNYMACHFIEQKEHMPPNCFSNVRSRNAKSKCNSEGRTCLWTMCPHISKKRSKPLTKSSKTKQSYKSSSTISERSSEERCDERTNIEINASWSKITSVSRWKSSTKEGKSILASG